MMTRRLVEEIISVYTKHGWKPGRVLLSEKARDELGTEALEALFVNRDVRDAGFDALWFERPSKKGGTAIELRHLGDAPFALFEHVANSEEIEEIRNEMENRMASYASKAATGRDH